PEIVSLSRLSVPNDAAPAPMLADRVLLLMLAVAPLLTSTPVALLPWIVELFRLSVPKTPTAEPFDGASSIVTLPVAAVLPVATWLTSSGSAPLVLPPTIVVPG